MWICKIFAYMGNLEKIDFIQKFHLATIRLSVEGFNQLHLSN